MINGITVDIRPIQAVDAVDIKPVQTLDVKELSCPIPLIQAKRAIRRINCGEILEVLCNYPDSKTDIPGWCECYGHEFLYDVKDAGFMRLYIRKGEKPPSPNPSRPRIILPAAQIRRPRQQEEVPA